MRIRQVNLVNFRNYENLRLDIEGKNVVITGNNGVGKTNILEAISMLHSNRGMRRASFNEILRCNSDAQGWAVSIKTLQDNNISTLGSGWNIGEKTRRFRIDGAKASSAIISENISMTWLTPTMDRVFIDSKSERRKFFDSLVSGFDASHKTRLNSFEKLVRERNKLLEKGIISDVWLDGIEIQMSELAVAIAAVRYEMLGNIISMGHDKTSSFPEFRLDIYGEVEEFISKFSALESEEKYREILRQNRNSDMRAGRTLHGPHRTDFIITNCEKMAPAKLCSTGEQKILLMGIVIAYCRAIKYFYGGRVPILLLDEVAAHLDVKYRSILFNELSQLGGQVWLTGTDNRLFKELTDAQYYMVENGKIYYNDNYIAINEA